jgi:hypothetical protein
MVLSSGVLRSMSKSGGVEAHSQVGEGHVGVYGMLDWKRGRGVERRRGMGRARRRRRGIILWYAIVWEVVELGN